MAEEPALVERVDPGRVWLLWFAIGATDEICKVVQRDVNSEGNEIFRQVVSLVFGGGARSAGNPVVADKRLIDLFEAVRSRGRTGVHEGRFLARLLPRRIAFRCLPVAVK